MNFLGVSIILSNSRLYFNEGSTLDCSEFIVENKVACSESFKFLKIVIIISKFSDIFSHSNHANLCCQSIILKISSESLILSNQSLSLIISLFSIDNTTLLGKVASKECMYSLIFLIFFVFNFLCNQINLSSLPDSIFLISENDKCISLLEFIFQI
jgi:hypothetical protein